jgi:hypothetical protein
MIYGGQYLDQNLNQCHILNVDTKNFNKVNPMPWNGVVLAQGIINKKLVSLVNTNDVGRCGFAYFDGQVWFPVI